MWWRSSSSRWWWMAKLQQASSHYTPLGAPIPPRLLNVKTMMAILLLTVLFICPLVDGALNLVDAVKLKSLKRAARLLRHGANVSATDSIGWTALHNAANMGQEEMVRLLVDYHAPLETPDPSHGKTALHMAAYSGQEEAVRALLEAGASVNVTDIQGQTPLHLAAWQGHLEVMLTLIDYGADIDVQDKRGSTPVFLATIRKFDQEVKELLIYCPDLRLPDNRGRTAVQYARDTNLTTILDIYKSHASKPCSRNRFQHLAKKVHATEKGKTCPRGERRYLDQGPAYSWWLRETQAGDTLVIPCPSGTNGTATWTCSQDGSWERTPVLNQCHAVIFGGWEEAMEEGKNFTAAEILNSMSRSLHNISLAPGDLLTLAHILKRLSDKHKKDLERSHTLKEALNLAKVYMDGMMVAANSMLTWPEIWWGLPMEERASTSTHLQASLTSAAVILAHRHKVPIRKFTKNKLDVQVIQQPPAYFSHVEERRYTHPHYNLTSLTLPYRFYRGYVRRLTSVKVVFLSYTDLHCTSGTLPCDQDNVQAERDFPAKDQVNSAIIGASVGDTGTWVAALGEVVEVQLEHVYSGEKFELGEPTCVWWDTHTSMWAKDGCHVAHTHPTYTMCHCDHLTNLAVIMDVNGILDTTDVLYYVMRCVTIIGCVVSVVSLSLCVVCFLSFKAVRGRASSVVHANLCLCLLGSELLVLGGLDATHRPLVCTIVAALLQYLFLATFTWSAIEAFHMYLSFVKMWKTGSIQVKYYLCVGYLVPLVYVSITFALTHVIGYDTKRECWLAPRGLIWTFAAPITVILLVNLSVFVMTIRVVWFEKTPKNPSRCEKKPGDAKWHNRRPEDSERGERGPGETKWHDNRSGIIKWPDNRFLDIRGLEKRSVDNKRIDNLSEDTKGLDNQSGDIKLPNDQPEDSKGLDNQPDNNHPEDTVTKGLDNQPEDTKGLDNQSGSIKWPKNQPEDTKGIENRSIGIKGLDNRPEDTKRLENRCIGIKGLGNRPGDTKGRENRSRDIKWRDSKPEESQCSEIRPGDSEGSEKRSESSKGPRKRPGQSKYSDGPPGDTTSRAELGKKFCSSFMVLLLLCFTWLTGFLYFSKGTHVVAVIFTLLNSLQGVGMLLLHIVMNEHIMNEVKSVLK
ncbi:uncharacterized protein LOC121867976 [Homarus americanus]|uniref:uncharacterized protein LOC121867976 n=1 Tax=Homarus americanus TaxID=6706 RepID=UPI001C49103D|nr:uncharacterized protein LOC121867976 [Homarus americanus]